MARLEWIEAGFYRIPLPEVLTDSTHGAMRAFEIVTARVRDADGAEGVGYTFTVGRNGGAVHDTLAHEIAELAVGEDADLIEALWRRVWWALHYGGRGGPTVLALSAFDTALWDLKAKRAGTALWRLLGGHDPRVPCYAGGIDLDLPLDALLRQTDANLARGFRAIKMKVGRPDLREDVERLAAIRAHLGHAFPLMVDANMAWTADEALERGRRLEQYGLYWYEEPTIPEDVAGHARLEREMETPIAVGESLHSPHEYRRYVEEEALAVLQIDPITNGGITASLVALKMADEAGLKTSSHYTDELSAHVLCASDNPVYLEKHAFALDEYLQEPQIVTNGRVRPTETPGTGLRFDEEKLSPYRAG